MFDKADDELIERLIKEAETIIKEELQKKLAHELGVDFENLEGLKALKDLVGLDLYNQIQNQIHNQNDRLDTLDADDQACTKSDMQESATTVSPKKRRGRPPKSSKVAQDSLGDDGVLTNDTMSDTQVKHKKPFAKSLTKESAEDGTVIKEAILEFVEREDGVLTLQEVGRENEPMVTIAFSQQAKEMIGADELQNVGQNMIHAAITTVMQRQMNAWHAHVYDETPKRYS